MSNVVTSKTKDDYLDNIETGLIVAFKEGSRVLSGMVITIIQKSSKCTNYVIQTKNGAMYYINKDDIIWVKTGKRWPKGVYMALKGEVNSHG